MIEVVRGLRTIHVYFCHDPIKFTDGSAFRVIIEARIWSIGCTQNWKNNPQNLLVMIEVWTYVNAMFGIKFRSFYLKNELGNSIDQIVKYSIMHFFMQKLP